MDYRVPEPSLPDDDPTPPTEPNGSLRPPPRLPPTAVSAAAAEPEPRPPRPVRSWSEPPRPRPTLYAPTKAVLRVLARLRGELWSLGKVVADSVMPRRRPN
jgi:hypothetical protein